MSKLNLIILLFIGSVGDDIPSFPATTNGDASNFLATTETGPLQNVQFVINDPSQQEFKDSFEGERTQ